jgi:hypothetical protein
MTLSALGMKVVPEEPTREMLRKVIERFRAARALGAKGDLTDAEVFDAMLSARPPVCESLERAYCELLRNAKALTSAREGIGATVAVDGMHFQGMRLAVARLESLTAPPGTPGKEKTNDNPHKPGCLASRVLNDAVCDCGFLKAKHAATQRTET